MRGVSGAARRGARPARGGFPIPSAAELHVPGLGEEAGMPSCPVKVSPGPPRVLVAVGLTRQVWAGTKPALAEPLISC